jgi:hypothetical protein
LEGVRFIVTGLNVAATATAIAAKQASPEMANLFIVRKHISGSTPVGTIGDGRGII